MAQTYDDSDSIRTSRVLEVATQIPKPEQLVKLSSDLQAIIVSLSPHELSIIGRALTGYSNLVFMKLPPEIREMIYSRLVIPEERTFRSNSIQRENKYQNDEYEEGGMSPRPTQPPARAFYCLSILRTSSIICNEALELMYKNVIYEFEARDNMINIMGNCAIVVHDAKDDIALTRFRQFHLIISAYNLHIDDTGIITFGIAHFFRHIQSILAFSPCV
ncbi:hypothetical protein EG327_002514 [Venturia inaequalis]|uniref:2EXR domain-containing protein n=1 Tax=Venturia inaequalis TaxID=5025 RepID=A0A8H3VTQ1_VENIN|nr:hypothetical protein EG327_002514 [Venturia inaequalis]